MKGYRQMECVVFLSPEVYGKQADLFSTMALVWHLTEILFIEVRVVQMNVTLFSLWPASIGTTIWLSGSAACGVGVLGREGGRAGETAGNSGPSPSRWAQ